MAAISVPGNFGKSFEVIVAAAAHSANRYPDPIICAEYSSSQSERRCARRHCLSCRLEKVTPINRHSPAFVLESCLQAA